MNWDVDFDEIAAMPDGSEKAAQWAVSGLLEDGAHHKQWFLERVLEALGQDLAQVREDLNNLDYSWDEGIAP